MQIGVDLQEVHDLLRLLSNVGPPLCCVKEQFHFQGLQIAVHKLKKRRTQPGDRLRGEVVVLVDAVLFRIKHHVELIARMFDGDACFCQRHDSNPYIFPMRSRRATMRRSIWRITSSVRASTFMSGRWETARQPRGPSPLKWSPGASSAGDVEAGRESVSPAGLRVSSAGRPDSACSQRLVCRRSRRAGGSASETLAPVRRETSTSPPNECTVSSDAARGVTKLG